MQEGGVFHWSAAPGIILYWQAPMGTLRRLVSVFCQEQIKWSAYGLIIQKISQTVLYAPNWDNPDWNWMFVCLWWSEQIRLQTWSKHVGKPPSGVWWHIAISAWWHIQAILNPSTIELTLCKKIELFSIIFTLFRKNWNAISWNFLERNNAKIYSVVYGRRKNKNNKWQHFHSIIADYHRHRNTVLY